MTDPCFEVVATDDLVIDGPGLPEQRALLSPYVWRDGDGYRLLLRAQPHPDGVTGRIWLGRSDDGLRFRLDDAPLIAPGPSGLDVGGCEDPTVVRHDGALTVFYTGVDQDGRGQMLYAQGGDIDRVEKRGVAFACSRTELNTKEATVSIAPDGTWRLLHEYAQDGRSCVGLATGPSAAGPWTEHPDPLHARADAWDCFHLSTGPLVDYGEGDLLMFYNGSDRRPRWSIGWATFDRETLALRDRCARPLIEPDANDGDARQIVFAASVIDGHEDMLHLYYSSDDMTPRRATLRRL